MGWSTEGPSEMPLPESQQGGLGRSSPTLDFSRDVGGAGGGVKQWNMRRWEGILNLGLCTTCWCPSLPCPPVCLVEASGKGSAVIERQPRSPTSSSNKTGPCLSLGFIG